MLDLLQISGIITVHKGGATF
nr:unnamed protein product [Callosobruchus analis]